MGGGAFGRTEDWLTTVLSWLGCPLGLRLSGCQVRRRHASSDMLEIDSRRDHCGAGAFGDETRLPLADGKAPPFEEFTGPGPGPGPNIGRPRVRVGGDWNGFAPDGTLSRRPGVRVPVA